MKARQARLNTIKKLIIKGNIGSQDILLESLLKEGFTLTQATLSRDLKALKVGKVSDGLGSYVYTLSGDTGHQETERTYTNDFLRGFISIDYSGNIVIVKTHSGHSDPVAVALDSLGFTEILGTIAGNDNTVAVFLKEGISGETFINRLEKTIPGLELKKE